MRNKKAQERLLKGLKWGKNGPDKELMNQMTAQIMTLAGVPMDIAQAFIFAAAGADFSDEDLAQIDAEMGTGFKDADLSHQFDMSTKRGRRDAYRFLRDPTSTAVSENLQTVTDTNVANAQAERDRNSALIRQEIARLSADGLTLEEVKQIQGMTGASGLGGYTDAHEGFDRGIDAATGNVYLDGVIVGTLVQEDADELRADGLPTPQARMAMDARDNEREMYS